MMKFRKDRVELLNELRNMVTKGLERSDDRRLSRRLKYMRKEVDQWISELKQPTKAENVSNVPQS